MTTHLPGYFVDLLTVRSTQEEAAGFSRCGPEPKGQQFQALPVPFWHQGKSAGHLRPELPEGLL